MVTFVIPSHNNLRHLKNLYDSIKTNAPNAKLVFLDDASTDGTYEWLKEISAKDENVYEPYRTEQRVGHTVLYDVGISISKEDIVGILHADMIVGPNYMENLLKHLKPKTVVCGTRVEPPLHPPGQEKIIMDFGMDFDDLNVDSFYKYATQAQTQYENQITYGMFAPWIIYKEDFASMGGHDALFSPFPYEDSDIFQRWMLSGYRLIQSRDAFVYHLTCRGHRWGEKVGKDDDYFVAANQRSMRNYLRKWGSWIQNDEYHHPILTPRYEIGIVIKNCNQDDLYALEPRFDAIRVDMDYSNYIAEDGEQGETPYDLSEKIKQIGVPLNTEVEITIDAKNMNSVTVNGIFNIYKLLAEKQLANEPLPQSFNFGSAEIKINEYKSKLTTIVSSETKRKYYVNDGLQQCVKPVIKNVF